MAEVELENITKRFNGRTVAVDDLNLTAPRGALTVLVGPSGCGKTTTLRLIAGLERPDHGIVRIGGRIVNEVAPFHREVAMVFQDAALYPHMTVRKNMVFPLRQRRIDRPEIERRVGYVARLLSIEQVLDRKPGELSGGEQQRAALARLIIQRPAVGLLDEPLNQLDAALRRTLREQIRAIQRRLGQTLIFVTHDQHEAMALGDQLVVMCEGQARQIDSPQLVYEHPADQFVARFIGDPPMNLLEGRVVRANNRLCFEMDGGHSIVLPRRVEGAMSADTDRSFVLGVRPSHLQPCAPAAADVRLHNIRRETVGEVVTLHGELPGGQDITVQLHGGHGNGPPADFTVDLDRAHLFEPGAFGRNRTADQAGSDNTSPLY